MDQDMQQQLDTITKAIANLSGQMSGFQDRLEARLDRRFDAIDTRFDDVEKDLATTKNVLTRVLARLSGLENKVGTLADRSGLHSDTLLEHDRRLRRLEEHRA